MDQEKVELSGLERMLIDMWERVLKVEGIGIDDNFFQLGADSVAAVRFTNMLQEKLGELVHITVVYRMSTIARLARYLAESYQDSLSTIFGWHLADANGRNTPKLTESDVSFVKETLSRSHRFSGSNSTFRPNEGNPGKKNPQAVFILCTPRSGSTLLRVMLGGHKKLFAPPELILLPFSSLTPRREAFSGGRSFWSEGVLRAIMEIKSCDADQAKVILQQCENRDLTIQEFYGLIQEWLGGRMLVDKSPTYAQSADVLNRAEEYFDNALYVHLVRHPSAMIKSFEDRRMEQLSFGEQLNYDARQLAELIWIVSHRNIIDFLKTLPIERHCRVVFEDLVNDPRRVMEKLCAFLDVDFDEEVLSPYRNQPGKMTDGTRPTSRMLGDPKFHTHTAIDPSVADRWKDADRPVCISDMALRLAEDLGYEKGPGKDLTPLEVLPQFEPELI